MGKTVLVVDDDADSLEMIEAILSPRGYRVIACPDPRQAHEKARESAPDVMVIDLVMPDLSGFQVIEEVRADPVTAALRVVVCTADESGAIRRADWLRSMHCEILIKPFELDDLFYILAKD